MFTRFGLNLKICSLKLLSDARKETFVSNELEHLDEQFKSIPKEDRSKITFHAVLATFRKNNLNLRGSVEFITTALKHMKDFNLHKDLDTYKALLDSFPKGPLIPQTKAQKIFLHFPQHQNCCIKVLDEMKWNALAVLEDNSRESAMAWMKHLQEDNSNLEKATILFKLKTSDVDVI
ncbi:Evolutionarily conserved signaling intermediate in Toll pathway, mitochondrial [Strongyloides ratti]|uniref:Evolutionarily conserved signaling intermediate in Toll pathway, mitochondrial n=1 Tax=Strongyloides ratti TaxID=34506 RepID=A0A090LKL1_STRRB|nr:Evolutionarily conserved signaling intermediate in Toll pathway, mitochondrial [Strongyloides ratti]CEF70223.1 Evolutionarily conserved signaling intermediate in Toll pathway, mitochondrial [Strongyloides ratti]